ncbi:MAG: hypothetical protein R3E44_00970 [Paracoccaceae bacterium]
MKIDDAYLDEFEDDIVRLSRRTYAEAGVPMFLVPEDLTGATPTVAPSPDGERLAALFEAVTAALEARNGPLSTTDIAHVIEVLADRHFLDRPFHSLAHDASE